MSYQPSPGAEMVRNFVRGVHPDRGTPSRTNSQETSGVGSTTEVRKAQRMELLAENSKGSSRRGLALSSEDDHDEGQIAEENSTSKEADTVNLQQRSMQQQTTFSQRSRASLPQQPDSNKMDNSSGGDGQIQSPRAGKPSLSLRTDLSEDHGIVKGPGARLSTVMETDSHDGSSDQSEYRQSKHEQEVTGKSTEPQLTNKNKAWVSRDELDLLNQRLGNSFKALERLESFNRTLENDVRMKLERIKQVENAVFEIPEVMRNQLEMYKDEYERFVLTPQEKEWENSVLRTLKDDVVRESEAKYNKMEGELRSLRDTVKAAEEETIMSVLTNFGLVLLSFFLEGIGFMITQVKNIFYPVIVLIAGSAATLSHRFSKNRKKKKISKSKRKHRRNKSDTDDDSDEDESSSTPPSDEDTDDSKNESHSRRESAFRSEERKKHLPASNTHLSGYDQTQADLAPYRDNGRSHHDLLHGHDRGSNGLPAEYRSLDTRQHDGAYVPSPRKLPAGPRGRPVPGYSTRTYPPPGRSWNRPVYPPDPEDASPPQQHVSTGYSWNDYPVSNSDLPINEPTQTRFSPEYFQTGNQVASMSSGTHDLGRMGIYHNTMPSSGSLPERLEHGHPRVNGPMSSHGSVPSMQRSSEQPLSSLSYDNGRRAHSLIAGR